MIDTVIIQSRDRFCEKKKEETGEHGGAAIQSNDLQRARVPNWKIVKDFYAGA